jgi:hypothetical protein
MVPIVYIGEHVKLLQEGEEPWYGVCTNVFVTNEEADGVTSPVHYLRVQVRMFPSLISIIYSIFLSQELKKIGNTCKYRLTKTIWTVPLSAVVQTGTFFTLQPSATDVVYVLPSEDEIYNVKVRNREVYTAKDAFATSCATVVPSLQLVPVSCSILCWFTIAATCLCVLMFSLRVGWLSDLPARPG